MFYRLVPSVLIIVLLQLVTSVYGLVQPSRCNRTIEVVHHTSCITCQINAIVSCPPGYVKLTTGMGVRGCIYHVQPGWYIIRLRGCLHKCSQMRVYSGCCPGFWGTDCRPCPGLENKILACYGKGNCSDHTFGDGTCQCNDGFEGFACEKCKDKTKFGDNCQKTCTCRNGTCLSGVMGNGTCQPYTCQTGYHGLNCEIYEPACTINNCHNNSHCVTNQRKNASCKCNPSYSGNGSHCEGINPCKERTNLCSSNAQCQYVGPGSHKCVCRKGYTGDGIVCAAIDPCQYNNGNCSNNAKCNYNGPGLSSCSCLPDFHNYVVGKGCSLIDLCIFSSISACDNINAECYMVKPGQLGCRCKSGFVGNGTICYGNILQRIDDLNRDGQYKGKLTLIKSLITHHSSLTRSFAATGPFTVFIATNDGIRKNLTAAQRSRIINDEELALHLILCHSVPAFLNTSDFVLNGNLTTLKGQDAVVTSNTNFFYQLHGQPTKSKIITTDIIASNGFIHILAFPAWIPNFSKIQNTSSLTLFQVIGQRPDLLTLKQLIQVAGMRSDFETVSTQGITFIAPTNEAFKTLDRNTTEFLRSLKGRVKLQAILQNHIFETKIHITEMIYMPTLFSRSSTLVSVSVKAQGEVILSDTGKLLETNIQTSNGVLYISSGLLVPSFVKPIVKKRCDVNESSIIYSPCNMCSRTFINDNCPSDTVSTGKIFRCFYRRFFLSYFLGCKTQCTRVVKHCCSGFYGPNCDPCPGPIGQPCYGNGTCFDNIKGNGICVCNSSFSGTACESCREHYFGLSCDKECTCVHGTCDDGRYGNGLCKPQSCKDGYFGSNCAMVMRSCGYRRIPCSIHAYCMLMGVIPKCACRFGYIGDGVICFRINPCQRANRGGCHENAICRNTSPGQNNCTCINGWSGNGVYCTPIDYCASPARGFCHSHAKCIFVGPGKVDCECRPGYKGNGMSCQEINSCLIKNGNCSPYAKCIKLSPGLNNCECRFGYTGNGYGCRPSMAVVLTNQKEVKAVYRLMIKTNLLPYLASAEANFTIFVPSDVAMNKLNQSMKDQLNVPENLLEFILSNMVYGMYSTTRLKNTSHLLSLENVFINISVSNTSQLLINGDAKIVVPNITASNGIIHIIDKVLLRLHQLPVKADLYQRLCMNQTDFSEMCHLITKYKLESKLKSLNYCTIFVPRDQAIDQLNTEQHKNFNLKGVQYHITEHFIPPPSIGRPQQFSTLAGAYYMLSLEKQKNGELTVNGKRFTYVDSAYNWIIYKISSVLKPVENVCFNNVLSRLALSCRPCFRRGSCPWSRGYRYAGFERCRLFGFFGYYGFGCRTICEKPVTVRKCCRGFWGKFCDACPSKNNIPCSGHGSCHDNITGTGICNCDSTFTGSACDRCKKGYYGDNCKHCNCTNNATCDDKKGFCLCPPHKKGLKCATNATKTKCGNRHCDQYASCNITKNNTCQCDKGYEGSGITCTHVDFCGINNGGCSPNAKCTFDPATLHTNCSCKPNYKGDGVFCQAKNPCQKNNNCHSNADCIFFRPGRSYCICKVGFSGDGIKSCSLVDPCSENNGGCSAFAKCSFNDYVNQTFFITCQCREGYIGDGTVCIGNLMESLQSSPELTEFFSRLIKSNVVEILSPQQNFSIIAPTNTAFVSSSRRKRRSTAGPSVIDLKYYIVGCVSITEEDVNTTGRSFISIAGSWLNITSPRVINNDINILSVHETVNGAIFIVDRMINASEKNLSNNNMSFVDAARKNGYGRMAEIINRTGLGDIVSNRHYGPFTMFWPSDEAINGLSSDIKRRLRNKNYKNNVRKILNYHIISKTKISTKDILSYSTGISRRTQEGASLYISCKGQRGDLYINDRSRIVQRDIPFLNGIAFGISEILLPAGLAGFCDEIKLDPFKGDCVICNGTGRCPLGTILQGVEQTLSCSFQKKYLGCHSKCLNRTLVRKCCKNFYGPDCQGCPGDIRNPCSGRAQCLDGVNGNGSCLCKEPYSGKACEMCNGTNCGTVSTICSGRKNPCSMLAICNTSKSQMCECIPGYEGDGFYCQEIDRCQKNNGNCSKNAICTYLGPNFSTCRCRPGYVGDGRHCSTLPLSHACATNNGGCDIHATCNVKDGSCACRKNFVGNGVYCGGSLMQVIYEIEELSEFAKAFRQLASGVEGHRIIRGLSSEAEFTVFAPVNYGFTVKRMTINELKNHIVQKIHFLTPDVKKETFLSLATNNITILNSNNFRVNNIANVVGDYPAMNGIIHVIDHVLPYIKPPKVPATKTPHPTTTSTTSTTSTKSEKHERNSNAKTIGIVVGVIFVFALIIVVLILVIRHRRAAGVRYNSNFGNSLFDSEPYAENSQADDDDDDDDYEHPKLQHPSAKDEGGTFIKNPTYVDTEGDLDEHLEMTETSSIVPLTKHDALA